MAKKAKKKGGVVSAIIKGVLIAVVLLFALVMIFGDDAPEAGGNPLMAAEIKTADVMNGTGDTVLGQRAYVEISKADFEALTDEQLAEFAIANVKGADYNWFTIDRGDGEGLCFTGCMIELAPYGDIDEEGAIVKAQEYWTVNDDGTVNKEKANG